jgi:hypothetical protein
MGGAVLAHPSCKQTRKGGCYSLAFLFTQILVKTTNTTPLGTKSGQYRCSCASLCRMAGHTGTWAHVSLTDHALEHPLSRSGPHSPTFQNKREIEEASHPDVATSLNNLAMLYYQAQLATTFCRTMVLSTCKTMGITTVRSAATLL